MRKSMLLASVAIALCALVTVPADGQVKIDRKPPGVLNKDLLGGLVISRLDAVRDAKKNNITITSVVANTSPFAIDRVTWTFSKWNGKEWTPISSSFGPGRIEAKQSLTTQVALAPTILTVKIRFEVRSATTKDWAWKVYTLQGADDIRPAGDILSKSTKGESVPRPKGDRLDVVDPGSRVVSLVNELRAKKGAAKLKRSASLDKIAQRYAAQLASKDQPIFKDQHGEIEPLGSDRIPETSSVLTD